MTSSFREKRGFALPLILFFIVICAIIAVGLFLSITRERAAALSMGENEKAKLVAQTATDHALALLENIPQPVPPGGSTANATNWITSPGLLTLVQGSTVTKIPLSTNPGATYAPAADDANLNRPLLNTDSSGNAIYPILGAAAGGSGQPLRVAWVNLLKDPSQPASKANPVVARYAFWIDDESTKLNANVAHGKPAAAAMDFAKPNPLMTGALSTFTGQVAAPYQNYALAVATGTNRFAYYPLWHPAAMNLDVLDLTGATLDQNRLSMWVHNEQNSGNASIQMYFWRPLEDPAEIKQFISGDADAYWESNKFDLTTRGRSPEFNVFGKSRLYWERQIPYYDNGMFFQFDYDAEGPTYTHGGEMTVSNQANFWQACANGMPSAARAIATFLSRNDWPGMPAKSFVDKWGGDATALREADQVAWNMVMMSAYSSNHQGVPTGITDLAEGNEAISRLFQNYSNYDSVSLGTDNDGLSGKTLNRKLFKGPLSGKAILPYFPVPLINEITFCVQPEEAPAPSPTSPKTFYLKMWFEVEYHMGGTDGTSVVSQRMPLSSFLAAYSPQFHITNVTYTAKGTQGEIASQTGKYDGGQGAESSGNDATAFDGMVNTSTTTPLIFRSGSYVTCRSSKTVYVTSGSKIQTIPQPSGVIPAAAATKFKSPVTVDISFRIANLIKGNYPYANLPVWQLIPVWDANDGGGSGPFAPPAGESDRVKISLSFDPEEVADAGDVVRRSIEIADCRLGGNSTPWQAGVMADGSAPAADDYDGTTLGAPNYTELHAAGDKSKIAYHDFQTKAYDSVFGRESLGMLSVIPTGMQRGRPNETFKFQPSADQAELPDWLVLELFAPALQPFAYMNSAVGKINPNVTFPSGFPTDLRWKPLQALVQNMSDPATVAPGATSPSELVRNILDHRLAGQDFGAPGAYDYIGELCEVDGFANAGADDWNREVMIRNLANLLTTRSNSFTVWGVAQIVRKKGASTNYGVVEPGEIVGEKRFRVEVEREVWPGTDGVPGNGTINSSGQYTAVAKPTGTLDPTTTANRKIGDLPWAAVPKPKYGSSSAPIAGATWPVIDGPDAPTFTPVSANTSTTPGIWGTVDYQSSPLEKAANPLRAWMRLNVTGFDYLDQ